MKLLHFAPLFFYIIKSLDFESCVLLISRMGVNNIERIVSPLVEKGLKSVLLFGVPTKLEKVN